MDNFENMEWDVLPPLPDAAKEMKKIRKNLRRRNIFTVFTCLILVAALAFGMIQYGIPALEKLYWDPNTSTYMDDTTDLELTVRAYTELFCPGTSAAAVEAVKTGFASYSLTTNFVSWQDSFAQTDTESRTATLSRGELIFPDGFWDFQHKLSQLGYDLSYFGAYTEQTLNTLRDYPDYIHVRALVHFPNDLTPTGVREFSHKANFVKNRLSQFTVTWVNVRNSSGEDGLYPPCGYDPNLWGPVEWRINSEYPYLDKYGTYTDTITLHFRSMLQFLQDQLENGTGILPPDCETETYYSDVLNYVEENGIWCDSASVISSADALISLYEEGKIDGIIITDAWVSY